MKNILIVIPARYQSSRLPGKPLRLIAGKEMIKRVAEIASYICRKNINCRYVVATDDQRIVDFCEKNSIAVALTSSLCKSGTERCWNAVQLQPERPDLIINFQGDNPLCPPSVIQKIIDTWKVAEAEVFTPCVVLSWEEYDKLVNVKKVTPYSGTTVLVDKGGYAIAFSKQILPSIRNQEVARAEMQYSPVRRHIGLYAYTYEALKKYFELPVSLCERNYIEGLEQMRFLENQLRVKMVEVVYEGRETTSGVDSVEDVERVEKILKKYGEFKLD